MKDITNNEGLKISFNTFTSKNFNAWLVRIVYRGPSGIIIVLNLLAMVI